MTGSGTGAGAKSEHPEEFGAWGASTLREATWRLCLAVLAAASIVLGWPLELSLVCSSVNLG